MKDTLGGFCMAALMLVGAIRGQEGWQVHGRVLSAASGRVLPGAVVTITGHQSTGHALNESWLEWQDPEPIVTDAGGCFRLRLPGQPAPGLADGFPPRLQVRVIADAHVEHSGYVFLSRLFATPDLELDPVVLMPGRDVELLVVDTQGRRQPGAMVWVWPQIVDAPVGWCEPISVMLERADMNGRARFHSAFAFGKHLVTVLDRMPAQQTIEVGRDGKGQFLVTVTPMERRVAIGRIVDSAGKGVGGVCLHYGDASEGRLSLGGKASLVTAGDGTFCIEGGPELPEQGDLWVVANHGRRCLGVIEMGRDAGPIEMRRTDRVVLRIQGLPKATSHPVTVRLLAVAGGRSRTLTVRSAQGEVAVDEVMPGSYAVKVHAIGIGTWPSEWQQCVVGADTEAIELRLPELVEQQVRVVGDDGAPIANARVQGILLAGKTFNAMGDPIEAYTRGDGMCSALLPWGMSSRGPDVTPVGCLLRDVTTDAKGLARLVAPAHADRFVVRVTGASLVSTFSTHDRFPIAQQAIDLKVPAAGCVVVVSDDPLLRTPRHVLTETEWRQACLYGAGADPWGVGIEGALQRAGCGLWLRSRGSDRALSQDLDRFCPFQAGRTPSWRNVPPGSYDIVLVVREPTAPASTAVSQVVGGVLAQVDVHARVEAKVSITLADEHRQALR